MKPPSPSQPASELLLPETTPLLCCPSNALAYIHARSRTAACIRNSNRASPSTPSTLTLPQYAHYFFVPHPFSASFSWYLSA